MTRIIIKDVTHWLGEDFNPFERPNTMQSFVNAAALCFHTHFADQNRAIHFLKNLAITGGLLQIVVFGAGAFSLDNRRR